MDDARPVRVLQRVADLAQDLAHRTVPERPGAHRELVEVLAVEQNTKGQSGPVSDVLSTKIPA